MLTLLKRNLFIVTIFLITLIIGFITFLTFIDKSFIRLNDFNLQVLLISNAIFAISLMEDLSKDNLIPSLFNRA